MVVIIDPHLKRVHTYPVYKEAQELGVLAKKSDGQTEYEGWCWSGSSAWVDFFNPASWEWWKGLFKTQQASADKFAWTESTLDVHIWNDMNEVSLPVPRIYADNDYVFSSLLSLTDLRSVCLGTTSTMAAGSTVTFTT